VIYKRGVGEGFHLEEIHKYYSGRQVRSAGDHAGHVHLGEERPPDLPSELYLRHQAP
jgi:hypothetical protein